MPREGHVGRIGVDLEPFAVAVEQRDEQVTLRVRGELDLVTVPELAAVLEQVDPGVPRLELDLARLAFIDSTGLGLLVRTYGRLRSRGRDLVVTGASGMVQTVLGVSGLDMLLDAAPPQSG